MNRHQQHLWMGVFPATLCPFHQDETLDKTGLRAYISNLCRVPGLRASSPTATPARS